MEPVFLLEIVVDEGDSDLDVSSVSQVKLSSYTGCMPIIAYRSWLAAVFHVPGLRRLSQCFSAFGFHCGITSVKVAWNSELLVSDPL